MYLLNSYHYILSIHEASRNVALYANDRCHLENNRTIVSLKSQSIIVEIINFNEDIFVYNKS